MESSSIRLMVVEDFQPFRRFICETLTKRHNLQIICEVSDGAEAVRQAKELRPDLILLDIGLPTLNRMVAAREILMFDPKTKVIFVTNESSTDIVQEALSMGVAGYVVKARVAIDLVFAVEAVLGGRQFVSLTSSSS